jgi:hypothetical protein
LLEYLGREGKAMPRSIRSTTAFIIAAFLLFFIGFMLKALVGAQMRPGSAETAYAPLEAGGAGASSEIAPSLRLSLPISRTQNGLTLGEPIATLRSSRRAVDAGKAASGAELLALLPRYLPKGATRMLGVYMDGRLAAITTNYRDDASESWEKFIAATAAKYGEPAASNRDAKQWSDGQVVLVLKKEDSGSISATVAFIDSLQKHYSKVSARGAGF